MEWHISYLGVLIVAVFAGFGGAAIGYLSGLAERKASERKYGRILAGMRTRSQGR